MASSAETTDPGVAPVMDAIGSGDPAALERSAICKALVRIVPFLGLCYFFAYLDRVNVGIAALQINGENGLSSAAFGLSSFLGTSLMGVVKDATGSFALVIWPLIGLILAGAICAPLISGTWEPLPAEEAVVR